MPTIMKIAVGVIGGYSLLALLMSDWLQENVGPVAFFAAWLAVTAIIFNFHH